MTTESSNYAASTGAFVPMAPLVIPGSPLAAVVLGGMTEWTLRQSLLQGVGSPMIFVTHPISFILLLISVILYAIPITRGILDRRQGKRETA